MNDFSHATLVPKKAEQIGVSLDPTPAPSEEIPSDFDDEHGATVSHSYRQLVKLAVGALGVVYGDIGTSPLYSIREALHSGHVTIDAADCGGLPQIPVVGYAS